MAKKRFLMKFVRFEIWQPSNRDDCSKFRLQKLGLWHEEPNWLDEQMETCEECKLWLDNLMDDVLDSQDGLFVHLAYVKDFKSEEEFQKCRNRCPFHGVKAEVATIDDKLKKVTLYCNPNSAPIQKQYEFPEDRFALCCPSCGTRLIDGKCLRCDIKPYEN